MNKETKDQADTSKSIYSELSSDNIKEITANLVSDLGEFLENRKEDIAGIKGKCKHQIKENPFVSVLSAVAVGIMLGIVLRR